MNVTNISAKKRILCIADLPDWIFNRHIDYLRQHLSDEFEIISGFRYEQYQEEDYDLIYPLEYMLVEPEQIENPLKYVTGIRSWISWADRDFGGFIDYLNTSFQRVHIISQELMGVFSPYLNEAVHLTNGIDLDFFSAAEPPAQEAGKLRLGWAGRRDTFIKGFRDYIEPLGKLPGIDLVFCGYVDRNLRLEEMPGFYSGIDAYICASSFEGSNNSLMEAAAMERAIISTQVGTAEEFLCDGESAIFVDRDVEQFKRAAIKLRDDPDLRLRLGQAARRKLVEDGWDWKLRAEEFRAFFREAIQQASRPKTSQLETKKSFGFDPRHQIEVISAQSELLREMRNGDWVLIMDQKSQIENLRKEKRLLEAELEEIRASETYRAMMQIRENPILKAISRVYQRIRRGIGRSPIKGQETKAD